MNLKRLLLLAETKSVDLQLLMLGVHQPSWTSPPPSALYGSLWPAQLGAANRENREAGTGHSQPALRPSLWPLAALRHSVRCEGAIALQRRVLQGPPTTTPCVGLDGVRIANETGTGRQSHPDAPCAAVARHGASRERFWPCNVVVPSPLRLGFDPRVIDQHADT